MNTKVVIRTGRHHGPEGIGDILHKAYLGVWLCREYEKSFGTSVKLLCDWRNTSYCEENVFPKLFRNKSILGVEIVTDDEEIDATKEKLPLYYGGLDTYSMVVPEGTYPFHGIELRFIEDSDGKLLNLWKTLVPRYRILGTGQFVKSYDFRDRKSFYQDLIFSEDVLRILHERFSKQLKENDKVLGLHYRHGNGELTGGTLQITQICEMIEDFLDRINCTSVLVCTDSIELKHAIKEILHKRGIGYVSMKQKMPEKGAGALHKKGLASCHTVLEDCAEMVALSRCDYLLFNYSFFNYYANYVGNYDIVRYVNTRGMQKF